MPTWIKEICDDFGWHTETSNTATSQNLFTMAGYSRSLNGNCFTTSGPYGGNDRVLVIGYYSILAKGFTATSEGHINFGFKIVDDNGANCPIIMLDDAGVINQLSLYYINSNNIALYRDTTQIAITTSGAFVRGVRHFIQFRWVINNSTGVGIVRVNNEEVINFSGDTQASGSISTANNIRYYRNPDGAGGSQNTYDNIMAYTDSASWPLNEARYIRGLPDAAGNYSQFTPLSSTNVSQVDEQQPDSDTTYNENTSVGNRDSFGTNLAVASGVSVLGSFEEAWVKKTDAGTRELKTFVRVGSTDYDGDANNITTDYLRYRNWRSQNPATAAAWTPAEINAAEVGYKDHA